jgi:hypothetical protein
LRTARTSVENCAAGDPGHPGKSSLKTKYRAANSFVRQILRETICFQDFSQIQADQDFCNSLIPDILWVSICKFFDPA